MRGLEEVTPVRRVPVIEDAPGPTACAPADVEGLSVLAHQSAMSHSPDRLVPLLSQLPAVPLPQHFQLLRREGLLAAARRLRSTAGLQPVPKPGEPLRLRPGEPKGSSVARPAPSEAYLCAQQDEWGATAPPFEEAQGSPSSMEVCERLARLECCVFSG